MATMKSRLAADLDRFRKATEKVVGSGQQKLVQGTGRSLKQEVSMLHRDDKQKVANVLARWGYDWIRPEQAEEIYEAVRMTSTTGQLADQLTGILEFSGLSGLELMLDLAAEIYRALGIAYESRKQESISHAQVDEMGSSVSVTVDDIEISRWAARWPASGLSGAGPITFEFDARNGDLVGIEGEPPNADGGAMVALSQDAQNFAADRLGIPSLRRESRSRKKQEQAVNQPEITRFLQEKGWRLEPGGHGALDTWFHPASDNIWVDVMSHGWELWFEQPDDTLKRMASGSDVESLRAYIVNTGLQTL